MQGWIARFYNVSVNTTFVPMDLEERDPLSKMVYAAADFDTLGAWGVGLPADYFAASFMGYLKV